MSVPYGKCALGRCFSNPKLFEQTENSAIVGGVAGLTCLHIFHFVDCRQNFLFKLGIFLGFGFFLVY